MTKKHKKVESEEEYNSDVEKVKNKINEVTLKTKTKSAKKPIVKPDKRAETSKRNITKARESRLAKLQAAKQEQQENIKQTFELPVLKPVKPQSNDSDEEELTLIINPPPVDTDKQQKKELQYQNLKEIYSWMQEEKLRKQNKQPKQNPVVINIPQVTKEKQPLNETDQILKDKILKQCNPMHTQIKF